MDLNQISIIGFLGKDAEVSSTSNQTPVTKFSLATNKTWKDDNGNTQSRTQWHSIVGFGKWPANLAPYLVKGAHVFVQGELITRKYEKTIEVSAGKKNIEVKVEQLAVEIRPESISLLDRRSDANEDGSPA